MPTLKMAWIPDEALDYPGWVSAGRRLGEFGRRNQWWIGDWIRYGNTRWGEKYVDAAKITGYDGKSLRNMAYVASRFDLSRRRDNLNWSHHAELAGLSQDEQDQWLERATHDRLSVADLRDLLGALRRLAKAEAALDTAPVSDATEIVGEAERRSPRRTLNATTPSTTEVASADALICPNCGATLPYAAAN
jgi:hypothetical protein